jgi:hypothetical protein
MASKNPKSGALERVLAVCWAASMVLFGIVMGAALAHGSVIPGEAGQILGGSVHRWLAAALYCAQVLMIVSSFCTVMLGVIVFTHRGTLEPQKFLGQPQDKPFRVVLLLGMVLCAFLIVLGALLA